MTVVVRIQWLQNNQISEQNIYESNDPVLSIIKSFRCKALGKVRAPEKVNGFVRAAGLLLRKSKYSGKGATKVLWSGFVSFSQFSSPSRQPRTAFCLESGPPLSPKSPRKTQGLKRILFLQNYAIKPTFNPLSQTYPPITCLCSKCHVVQIP